MPRPAKRDWGHTVTMTLLILAFTVFWTVAAYGVSHWRGAPFSPKALALFAAVTCIAGIWLFSLARMGKD